MIFEYKRIQPIGILKRKKIADNIFLKKRNKKATSKEKNSLLYFPNPYICSRSQKNMKCLVTGGAGFIGSHLVHRLLKEGHHVAVIDDLSFGKTQNLAPHYGTHPNLSFFRQSITEPLDIIFQKEQPEVLFHLAALPRVQFSLQHPQETHEVNVNGTLHLLIAAKKHGVSRVVFTSSSATYGDQPTRPFKETMLPNPLSPYAIHKLIGEQYCTLFAQCYGLETVSLRYFNVFGPKQDASGDYACLIPKVIQAYRQQKPPRIFGDGNQTRDFIYVGDIVEANMKASQLPSAYCKGNVFNIGSGKECSVNEIVHTIQQALQSPLEPTHEAAVLEPRNTCADVSYAKTLLNWEPRYSFETAIQETLAQAS